MIRSIGFPLLIIGVLAVLLPEARGANESADNQLKIPDVCSIDAPGKGWAWKAVQEYDPEKGGAYVCSAEGKPGKVFLRIDARKYQADGERINVLKVQFNLLHNQLEKLGCTDIKGKRPNISPPIGRDVDYLLFGKTTKGTSIYFDAHTIFKDHTFTVQAVAPSLEQAQKLEEVEKTLK
jgi:hypothetical protein